MPGMTNILSAAAVFARYAISAAIPRGSVIFVILRIIAVSGRLQQKCIELLMMPIAGLINVHFSLYGLYSATQCTCTFQ